MKKLTKRESTMLYILACVVIAVCGFRFLILPAMESYSDLQSQVADTRETEMEIHGSIEDIKTVQENADKLRRKLQEESASYLGKMADWELDNLITGMLQKHNLKPQSLHVSSPASSNIKSYSETKTTSAAGSSSTTQASNSGKILVSDIKTDVKGTISDFIALSDEISSTPSLRITKFYMADNNPSGESTITIDIEVLMYDKDEG